MSDNRCCNHHNVFCFLRQAGELIRQGTETAGRNGEMTERGKILEVFLEKADIAKY